MLLFGRGGESIRFLVVVVTFRIEISDDQTLLGDLFFGRRANAIASTSLTYVVAVIFIIIHFVVSSTTCSARFRFVCRTRGRGQVRER